MWSRLSAGIQMVQESLDHVLETEDSGMEQVSEP